jgi:DNA-binding NarL/FixJ family response regulator
MLDWNIGQPIVLVCITMGLLSLAFAFISWRMRRNLVRTTSDIQQLRQVVQDLISLQEYRFTKLKAEINAPQSTISGRPAPSTPSLPEVAERKRYIWGLAEKGVSTEEIARRMSLPYGQVEVLLNMKSYSDSYHA